MRVGSNSDYVVRSDAGDPLVTISTSIPVNDLRYFVDHLDQLKIVIQKGLIENMNRCFSCKSWQHPWQGCDSGSGMGYTCRPSKEKIYFEYWGYNSTISPPNDSGYVGKQMNIILPDSKERDPKYVGKKWLADWDNFKSWLNSSIGSHVTTFTGDLNKLNGAEELELHRLINKMNE